MILSLNKKSPLTPSFIKEKLVSRHLLDSSLKKSEIFYYMKRFIDFDIGEKFNEFDETRKANIIKCVFRTIEKLMKDKTKTMWMKTFAIHAFFRFFILNYEEKGLFFANLLEEINEIR